MNGLDRKELFDLLKHQLKPQVQPELQAELHGNSPVEPVPTGNKLMSYVRCKWQPPLQTGLRRKPGVCMPCTEKVQTLTHILPHNHTLLRQLPIFCEPRAQPKVPHGRINPHTQGHQRFQTMAPGTIFVIIQLTSTLSHHELKRKNPPEAGFCIFRSLPATQQHVAAAAAGSSGGRRRLRQPPTSSAQLGKVAA